MLQNLDIRPTIDYTYLSITSQKLIYNKYFLCVANVTLRSVSLFAKGVKF
jgi:hypothetical protein